MRPSRLVLAGPFVRRWIVAVDLATGRQVGRYQLLFRLGKGGMGEVWAARQTSNVALGFRKVVALKVLRSREITSNAALMFLDEAKAASVLQHPAIVPTVDLGQDGDLLYIAMDLVQGPSLTTLLQRLVINRGRVPPSLVAYLGTRLAGALEYAHTRAMYEGQPLNLVHRDVSPHNVLVDVHSGEVRLTDFGVARTSIQDHESRAGTVRGKPSYMAPEQVVGGEIDHRTDLFALGIVLYESACLKRLFGRQNPVKSMDAVIRHTPRALTELVEGFPHPLWRIIRRALNKDVRKRWANASEMQDALADVARGIDGGASPGHELVELVNQHFEPGTFDLEARLREIDAEGLLEPTSAEAAPSEGVTRVFWPSEDAPDPLAPEAIEAARTRYQAPPAAPGTPMVGATQPVLPSVSANSMVAASYASGLPSVSANSISARSASSYGSISNTALRRRTTGPAIFLAVAAMMLATAVSWLALRPRPVQVPIAPLQPPAQTTPVAQARRPPTVSKAIVRGSEAAKARGPSTVKAGTGPLRSTTEAARDGTGRTDQRSSSTAANEQRGAAKTENGRGKGVKTAKTKISRRRRSTAPRSRQTAAAPAPAKAKAPVAYEDVHRLLHRVKALDDVRGTTMIVTLAEAGRNNQEALDRLARQAREFLRSRGRAD